MSFEADLQRLFGAEPASAASAATRQPGGFLVRAGIPQIYGALVEAAAAARIPALFSANAFSIWEKCTKRFTGFRTSALKKWPADWDVALDSAGFTALAHYGDFPWQADRYVGELVTARDWTWWAAMDYCVEPEVASTRVVRDIRIEATVQGYWRACDLAKKHGVKSPLPVIQGQSVESYLKCVEAYCLRDAQWPELVGLGSVCRRNVYGPNGIATVIDALDKVLPAHVKLHLFGVKGQALQRLGAHPRFATVDSQAWDYTLRAEQRTGRTQAMRVNAMLGWHARQSAIVPDLYEPAASEGEQLTFGLDAPPTAELVVHTAVADWYSTWLLADHGYREVAWMALEQAQMIMVKLQHAGPAALAAETDEATIAAYDALAAAGYVPQREEEAFTWHVARARAA